MRGFRGGRVEVIAREADVNKRMLYHYFGSKEGLFEATLTKYSGPNDPLEIEESPESSVTEDTLTWKEGRKNALLQVWESLRQAEEGSRSDATEEGGRPEGGKEASWQASLTELKQAQREQRLPVELNPAFLQLALLGIEVLPYVLPELAERVTGEHPSRPSFDHRRERFRSKLLDLLASCARQTPLDSRGKPRIRLGG